MNVLQSIPRLGLACLVFITATLASPAIAQTDDLELRPDWAVGQTATYEFWTQRQRDINVSFAGRTREVTTLLASEGHSRWQVTDVAPDGSATATMTLEWIVITLTGPDGKPLKVDSRRPGGDIPTYKELVDAVAGVPLTVQVNADGTIVSVAGLDAMRRQWSQGDFPLDERDFIETATDTAVLPGVPPTLRPAGTWTTAFAWGHELGTLHHDLTWTLASVEDVEGIGLATIDVAGTLRLEVDPDNLPDDAPPTDYRLTSGSFEGQVLYDLQRREAVGRNGVQEDTIVATTRLPDGRGTLQRTTTQRLQSQTLRVEEGD
ncbi:MAG: hypothetical protein AAFY08_12355 [Planctomycetota bacterium]